MSDEAFSNDLDARIEAAVQYMMHNLDIQFWQQNLNSLINTISFLIFKLEEIRYFDSELDTWYDEEDIITVEKDSYTWDMHLFISWIKNVIAIKEADQVKIQLLRALKEIALK